MMATKRKNPYSEENTSPAKKRKIDDTLKTYTIKFTATGDAKAKEQSFSIINKKSFKVGREPKCEIVFENTPMVSRIHCQFIFKDNHQLFCKDLKSTNGVFINNEKIDKNGTLAPVSSNDIIRFGKKYKKYNHEYKVEIIENGDNNNNNNNSNTSSLSLTQMSSLSSQTSSNGGGGGSIGNLMDIQAILQQTVKAQLAEHTKAMEAKLAAKDAENAKIKQRLHEKEMKDLAAKAKKQKEELEKKQKEVEKMKTKMEKEKVKQAAKLKAEKERIEKEKQKAIEESKKKQEEELAKMKQKEEETKQKLSLSHYILSISLQYIFENGNRKHSSLHIFVQRNRSSKENQRD